MSKYRVGSTTLAFKCRHVSDVSGLLFAKFPRKFSKLSWDESRQMSTALFRMDCDNKRIPYFRPPKLPFAAKCIEKFVENSKRVPVRKSRSEGQKGLIKNQKSYCALRISVTKTRSENPAPTTKKKQKRKLFSSFPGKLEFPDDLNQHFYDGSINFKEDRDQSVPTMIALPDDVIQNCAHGFFEYNSKKEKCPIPQKIMTPQTPIRRAPNSRGGLRSDFSSLHPGIVPETPLRVLENQDYDKLIFCVPETPEIRISKVS